MMISKMGICKHPTERKSFNGDALKGLFQARNSDIDVVCDNCDKFVYAVGESGYCEQCEKRLFEK